MALTPTSQQAASSSVTVSVPIPTQVQPTQQPQVVQKPPEETEQPKTNKNPFKKNSSIAPQSLIFPSNPPVSSSQNQLQRLYEELVKYAAKKKKRKLRDRIKHYVIGKYADFDSSSSPSCYAKSDKYSSEDNVWLLNKVNNIHDGLPHLVHADDLQEQGFDNIARHIRESVYKGSIDHSVSSIEPEVIEANQKYAANFPYTVFQLADRSTKNKLKGIVLQHHYVTDDGQSHTISYNRYVPKDKVENEYNSVASDIFHHKENSQPLTRYTKRRSPSGGMIVRGQYFSGGSFLPEVNEPSANSQQNTNPSTPPKLENEDKWLAAFNKAKKIWRVGKKPPKIKSDVNVQLSKLYECLIKYASKEDEPDLNEKQVQQKYRGPSYSPRTDENWYDENWQHVTSSNVQSVAYNPDFKRMYIEFKRRKGGHAVYQYENVPENMHDQLMSASSKGKFVYYILRNNGTDSEYAYRQID